jgi:hypothetical protein
VGDVPVEEDHAGHRHRIRSGSASYVSPPIDLDSLGERGREHHQLEAVMLDFVLADFSARRFLVAVLSDLSGFT